MAGGDILTTELIGTFEQGGPFYMGITEHTWIRCSPFKVFIYKVTDDIVIELFPDIEHIVGKSEAYGQVSRIIYGIKAATTCFLARVPGRWILPGFHGNAHHLITFLYQHHGRHAAVQAAAHRHQYSFLGHNIDP